MARATSGHTPALRTNTPTTPVSPKAHSSISGVRRLTDVGLEDLLGRGDLSRERVARAWEVRVGRGPMGPRPVAVSPARELVRGQAGREGEGWAGLGLGLGWRVECSCRRACVSLVWRACLVAVRAALRLRSSATGTQARIGTGSRLRLGPLSLDTSWHIPNAVTQSYQGSPNVQQISVFHPALLSTRPPAARDRLRHHPRTEPSASASASTG